ncbi:unnamed protein product, partial [Ectocarpus sp. 12 AP-2014]
MLEDACHNRRSFISRGPTKSLLQLFRQPNLDPLQPPRHPRKPPTYYHRVRDWLEPIREAGRRKETGLRRTDCCCCRRTTGTKQSQSVPFKNIGAREAKQWPSPTPLFWSFRPAPARTKHLIYDGITPTNQRQR